MNFEFLNYAFSNCTSSLKIFRYVSNPKYTPNKEAFHIHSLLEYIIVFIFRFWKLIIIEYKWNRR